MTLEDRVTFEAYTFYKNKLEGQLSLKNSILEVGKKKLKVLKNKENKNEFNAFKQKIDKEIASAKTLKEKIFIVNKKLSTYKGSEADVE